MFEPRASNGEDEVPRTVISRLRSPDGRGTARIPSMVPPVAYSGTDTPSSCPLSNTVALLECFTKCPGELREDIVGTSTSTTGGGGGSSRVRVLSRRSRRMMGGGLSDRARGGGRKCR